MPKIILSPKLFRISFIAILISLALLYAAQWTISQSDKSGVEDFIIFYTAGTVARTRGFDSVYDIEQQLATQQQILGAKLTTGEMLVYNHLPSLVPIFYLLAHLDYAQTRILWGIFLVILYGSSIFYLLKSTNNLPAHLNKSVAAAIFLFYPIFVSLYHGQDTAFLFLGLALWYAGLEKKQENLIIIGVMLSTFRPHIASGIIIAYSISHPKQLWKLIVAGCIWATINLAMVGPQGMIDFIRILSLSAEGAQLRMSDGAMLNLLGLLNRVFDTAPASLLRAIGWVGYFIGIFISTWAWMIKNRPETWAMCLSILAALFFAPHLHYHDLAVAAIPLVFALTQSNSMTQKYLLLSILPLFSLFTLLTPAWYHAWPYFLYSLLVIAISFIVKKVSSQYKP